MGSITVEIQLRAPHSGSHEALMSAKNDQQSQDRAIRLIQPTNPQIAGVRDADCGDSDHLVRPQSDGAEDSTAMFVSGGIS